MPGLGISVQIFKSSKFHQEQDKNKTKHDSKFCDDVTPSMHLSVLNKQSRKLQSYPACSEAVSFLRNYHIDKRETETQRIKWVLTFPKNKQNPPKQ